MGNSSWNSDGLNVLVIKKGFISDDLCPKPN